MLYQSQTDTTLARFRTRLANARKAAWAFTPSPAWRRQAHNPACAGSVVQIHPPQPIFLTVCCISLRPILRLRVSGHGWQTPERRQRVLPNHRPGAVRLIIPHVRDRWFKSTPRNQFF